MRKKHILVNFEKLPAHHIFRVAERLEKAGFSKEVICAGHLHDVVEDTPCEMEDIQRLFGPRVAELVAAHTEDN